MGTFRDFLNFSPRAPPPPACACTLYLTQPSSSSSAPSLVHSQLAWPRVVRKYTLGGYIWGFSQRLPTRTTTCMHPLPYTQPSSSSSIGHSRPAYGVGRWALIQFRCFFLIILLCTFAAQFGSDDKTLQTDRQTHHHLLVQGAGRSCS